MMYWLRCAMLSVSIFFLTYIVVSALLAMTWRWLRSKALIVNADTLFTLRILPLILAIVLVALVTIPSFWSLEPTASDEGIGWPIAVLFAASMIWIVSRGARIFSALRQASRFFAAASLSTPPLEITSGVPAYVLPDNAPNLFVAGLWRPRIFISRGAIATLDAQEMQAAIRHELAHAQGSDNLKQLLVRICAFPALLSLDQEWLRAAEIVADDRAATDESRAADLASALVKVGVSSARMAVPELSMSLVPEFDTPVSDRVRRLLEWHPRSANHGSRVAQFCLLSVPVGIVALNLVFLMGQMHRFTEILFQ